MKVTWFGHACFLFDIEGVKVLVDPFIRKNPLSPIKLDDLERIDVVLATHDHGDHLGDLIEISREYGSVTVGVYEFAEWLSRKGLRNVIPANVGGNVRIADKLSVKIVPAVHTCSVGVPVGYIISTGGESVYHAGDTCYTSYMKFIGSNFDLKAACLPIGDHYTMGIEECVQAIIDLKPRYVFPMHYGTFDVIRVDVSEFKRMVEEKTDSKPVILKPGESIEI